MAKASPPVSAPTSLPAQQDKPVLTTLTLHERWQRAFRAPVPSGHRRIEYRCSWCSHKCGRIFWEDIPLTGHPAENEHLRYLGARILGSHEHEHENLSFEPDALSDIDADADADIPFEPKHMRLCAIFLWMGCQGLLLMCILRVRLSGRYPLAHVKKMCLLTKVVVTMLAVLGMVVVCLADSILVRVLW